jgi:hypothetical protein
MHVSSFLRKFSISLAGTRIIVCTHNIQMLLYSTGSLAGGNRIPDAKAERVSGSKVTNCSQDGCPYANRLEGR